LEIYNIINTLCEEQKAVLLISSELPEIIALSDTIFVVCEGKITGQLSREECSQEKLLKYAIGG